MPQAESGHHDHGWSVRVHEQYRAAGAESMSELMTWCWVGALVRLGESSDEV